MILALAAVAIVASVWSGDRLLLGVVSFVLWCEVLLHQRDLRFIVRALHSARKPSLNPLRSAMALAWSRLGGVAAQHLDTVLYRIGVLQWELDQQRSRNESVRAMQAPLGGSENIDLSASSDHELHGKVLEHMVTRYRAKCVAIIEAVRSRSSSAAVVLKGDAPPRAERYIESFLRGYIDEGSSSALGYVSHVDAPRFFADFSSLGIYHTVVEPVLLPASDKMLILWWGFGGIPPTQEELERARELREVVSEQWRVMHLVRNLNDKAQRAESLVNQRDQYLTQLSHDLRTPLHNVLAVLSLMKDEGVNSSSAELIDVAAVNCRALGELLEDVLDYARHEAGFLVAKQGVIDVGEALSSLVASFRVSARAKGLELRLEPVQADLKIQFDSRHFRRILSNFLSNAIKYTESGEVSVSVRIEQSGSASVMVRDSGPGIGIEEQKRLFQPFVRLSSASSDGNGLGLVVTKLLAEANAAEILVESHLGQGSTFTLALGRSAVSQVALGPVAAVPAKSVLLVDDDIDTLLVMERILGRAGYVVHRAQSAEEALRKIDANLSAIITDGSIPGGSEAVLRRCQSHCGHAKRILCSGNVRLTPELAALVDKTFEKPVEGGALLEYLLEEETQRLQEVA
ncbi:MAG: hybrid sensor histidine kinase/response regulator [Bdellovibrionota bacterium]|nr:MAG: hybrid sensor histidine kinase/response regulator [Bdellovibrionota bacterium]